MHHATTSNKNQVGRLGTRLLATTLVMLGLVFFFSAATASAVIIRSQVEAFGPDDTAASSFSGGGLGDLTFNQATRGLYAVDGGVPGIYGFDVSALPAHSPLGGFSPLPTAAAGGDPGIAVDNTALASSGNVYFVSEGTGLVYGFDKTGDPLGGNFPIDPAITPGAPIGSPKDICGAGVDSAGNVWVANFSSHGILEYSSAGVYQASVSTAGQDLRPCSVSFDSNGDLYASDGNGPSGPTYKYTAASGYTAATLIATTSGRGNTVDRSTHHVFTINNGNAIGEYNSAGSLISTTSEKDSTGDMIIPTSSGIAGASIRGVAVDSANDRLYAADQSQGKIRVFGDPLAYPDLTLGTVSSVENTSAAVDGTVSTQNVALTDCHFEYVNEAGFATSGFNDLSSGGSVPCSPGFATIPTDSAIHSVSASLNGLSANTGYRVRLVAANPNGPIATVSSSVFDTTGPPVVETTGSPLRTTTSARLDARVNPERAAATFRFEYGDQGPCDSNPCTSTDSQPAGSGGEFELVSQQIGGLQPNTIYHYRVVADNGNPDGPRIGEDMTVVTRGDEAPLSHGHFPGPVGSDRAWELVSAPDTGGNPVGVSFAPGATTISDAGDRAVYGVAGGTPDSETGTVATTLFTERTPSGWQTRKIFPRREDAKGTDWTDPSGPADLSSMVVENSPTGKSGEFSVWRLTPNGSPVRLFHAPDKASARTGFLTASDGDGSRVVMALVGPQDPVHPVSAEEKDLYDVSSGSPRMVSLLPNGTVPPCGIPIASVSGPGFREGPGGRTRHYVSPDGSLVFFQTRSCVSGNSSPGRFYVRDIPAETTKLISTPPVSGLECDAYFIKSIPDAAFFYSQSRLVAEDVEPKKCQEGGSEATGGDVYRYDLGDGALQCLTCVAPGLDGEVIFSGNSFGINGEIGVAEDGSRVYFTSGRRLLSGAATQNGTYRLDVASGDLAYVGAFGYIGDVGGSFMNPDGSAVAFRSNASSVNALGGQQNGGTMQFYLYNDGDRSLVCVSCPPDGSAPQGPATGDGVLTLDTPGANRGVLSSDGKNFAFKTLTALVPADQNTVGAGQNPASGTDVYEWRDGRLLLISDGLTNWPAEGAPKLVGITPSGNDIFFVASAQLTPDALDGYNRLYDARIGGGFEFPSPPKPCPLEVCQGTPKGAPEEVGPGTATLAGAGNTKAQKAKKHHKKRHKKHAKKTSPQRKANNNRRTAR